MKMETTLSYKLYKSIIIQKGLKVIWKPDEDVFDKESFKDVSDYFRIEVNYKSKESKLFEIEVLLIKDKCLLKSKNVQKSIQN